MDLEAILDAGSSSSSQDSPSYQRQSAGGWDRKLAGGSKSGADRDHDLEDILRIASDNDDDYDAAYNYEVGAQPMEPGRAGASVGNSTISTRYATGPYQLPPRVQAGHATADSGYPSDDGGTQVTGNSTSGSGSIKNPALGRSIGASNAASSSRLKPDATPSGARVSTHSAEDWAVLQSILDETNDGDDDYDVGIDHGVSADDGLVNLLGAVDVSEMSSDSRRQTKVRSVGRPGSMQSSTSSNPDVDAILMSVDQEDEEEEGDTVIADGFVFNFGSGGGDRLKIERENNISQTLSVSKSSAYQGPRDRRKNMRSSHHEEEKDVLSPKSPTSITAAFLRHAKSIENKLLRPSQRDIVSPLMVKRRMKPKIELKASNKSTCKTTAVSGQELASVSSASVMKSKSLGKIGKELISNAKDRASTIGLPTALAVSSKFIAIGTQQGHVLVFDHFQVLKQRLGRASSGSLAGGVGSSSGPELSETSGAVTSIDLSHDGDALIAGYNSGLIVLWDCIRGIILKSFGEAHPSPITSVRFFPKPNTLSVVTVDAGGLVNRLTFSKAVLWGTYSVETECLLDGTAGQILATQVLAPPPAATSSIVGDSEGSLKIHPCFDDLILLGLSSERSTFAVAIEPKVSVLYRWAKPTEDVMNLDAYVQASRSGSTGAPENYQHGSSPHSFLPCISWGWCQIGGGGKSITPMLARAWGCSVQFLRASFPDSDSPDEYPVDSEGTPFPAFGNYNDFQATAPVVALEWLGQRSLAYLTVTNEFTVVDTVMMTLTERLDFSIVKLVYAEFSLSHAASTSDKKDDSDSINVSSQFLSTTFQNSIRSNEGRILVLCQEDLLSVSNLGIQQRIVSLEEDGEWLEALALALDHYESTVKVLEDRRRARRGDLSRHPEFLSRERSEDEEWIAELLLRYMRLAVDNAPEPSRESSVSSGGYKKSRFVDLAHGHFQMLAGVCIDFCSVTRRLDLLFGAVFDCFESARFTEVFFDVLEPYVLDDRIDYIAPQAMTYFIQHYKARNELVSVERCLLHLDVTIMDFDTILSLLRANSMHTALIHVYTRGLDEFIAPLSEMFEAIFDAADSCDISKPKRSDGIPQNEFELHGYKAILYVQHCLEGKFFPSGDTVDSNGKIQILRHEIMGFFQQQSYAPPSASRRGGPSSSSKRTFRSRKKKYPYLHLLVHLDTKALLDTMSIFFDEQQMGSTRNALADFDEISSDRQDFVSTLARIIMPEEEEEGVTNVQATHPERSQVMKDSFLDFMATQLLKGAVTASAKTIMLILSRMSKLVKKSSGVVEVAQKSQADVLELLHALPRGSYDHPNALNIVSEAGLSRAALFLHRESLTNLLEIGASNDIIAHHFCASIDCYLNDGDADFRPLVFDYITNDCISNLAAMYPEAGSNQAKELLKDPMFAKLPELINLDAVQSAQLIADIFIEDLDDVIGYLQENEIALFNFFHAIVSGALSKLDPIAGPLLLSILTVGHQQSYLELMARYHPEKMYQHLSTNDNYRVEDCLRLCQENDIADASAYLLERMGNVSSALQLMLQTLEVRLVNLKRVVRATGTDTGYRQIGKARGGSRSTSGTKTQRKNPVLADENYKKEVVGVKQSLVVALDLCERNTSVSKARSEHGSQLWFNILDRLLNANGFLRLSKELPGHAAAMATLLSELLELSMQRMVTSVPLADLLRKITADHSGSSLGEFREMLTTLLKTYNTELNLRSGASDVTKSDAKRISSEKRRQKLRGHRVDIAAEGSSSALNCNKVILLYGNDDQFEGVHENKGTTLARLQARRSLRAAKQGRRGLRRGRISLSSENESSYVGTRQIGRLSAADHFGRLA